MRTAINSVSASVVAATMLVAGNALAAPQILGLTAQSKPVDLQCRDGVCTTELASFCLQKRRDDPEPGTAYTIHGDGQIDLHVKRTDGRQLVLPAKGRVKLTARRSFTAVSLSVAEADLKTIGAEAVTVSVGEGVSLVPVPVVGDQDPITEEELAYVTSTLRAKADAWLGGNQSKPVAVGIVNRLINATPLPGERMAHNDRRDLWKTVVGDVAPSVDAAGRQRAADMYEACLFRVEVGRYPSLRSCLEVKQDSLLLDMNTRYWKSNAFES